MATIGLAVALLSIGAAARGQPPAMGPRICWQDLPAMLADSFDLRTAGLGDRLAVTDGAHPAARLELLPGERPYIARGDDPLLFLRWPDGEALSVWAQEPGLGVRQLTVAVVEPERTRCTLRGSGAGPLVTIEALSEGAEGTSTCIAWPLSAGAPSDTRWPGSKCFPIAVPDLVGRPLAEARRTLAALRLLEGRTDTRPTSGPPELVVDQRPTAGSGSFLVTGDAVDLVVSASDRARVPDLSGRSVTAASSILDRLGVVAIEGERQIRPRLALSVLSAAEPTELAAEYRIGRQRPVADTEVRVPATVEVEVALVLPDLRGLPTADARRWLCARGLVPAPGGCAEAATLADRDSTVRQHSPAARQPAWHGSTVAIESEREPRPPLPVALAPDIEGLTVGEAEAELARQGLELGLEPVWRTWLPWIGADEELERWRVDAPPHRLNMQQPRPRQPLAGRGVVTARIEVLVPHVLWRQAGPARQQLAALRLEPRTWRRLREPTRASSRRIVVSQDPPAQVWRPSSSPVLLHLDPGDIDDPPPHEWPWKRLALLAAALTAVTLRPRFKKLPPEVKVKPHPDTAGSQRIEAPPAGKAAPAFRLRPRWDPGSQWIETSTDRKGEAGG